MVRRFLPAHLPLLFSILLAAATSVAARPELPPGDPGATTASLSAQTDPASGADSASPGNSDLRQRMRELDDFEPQPLVPPDAPSLPDAVRDAFGHGYARLRVGDYSGANAAFAPFTESADPIVAAEALFRVSQIAVLEHRNQDAVGTLYALRDHYPDSRQAGEGALMLGTALRGLGDCPGAIDAYAALARERPLLAAHAFAFQAECYRSLDLPAESIAADQAVLAESPPRLLRLDALERQALNHLHQGDQDAALEIYAALLEESRTRSYTAELLYTVGLLHESMGNRERATQRLLSVVVDYPESSRAGQALDALNQTAMSDLVSWYQAGLVRMYQRRLTQAIHAFDQSLAADPSGPDAAAATYQRGTSKVRIDDMDSGIADLLAVADGWPNDPLAPQALLQVGLGHEYLDRWQEAADAYTRLETDYPSSAAAVEGRFRNGLTWYARGDYSLAATVWGERLAIDTAAEARARLFLWRGMARSLSGDREAARADWSAALEAAPESFSAIRARDLLAGNGVGTAWPAIDFDTEVVDPGLDDWLREHGDDPATVEADVAAEPRFQRADALLRLGQRLHARWELDDLIEEYASRPGRLYALAGLLEDRGAYDLSALTAQRALAADPAQPLLAAPPALQRLAYPIAYAELLEWQRQERGADPLLMLALMRQESSFNPRATSVADARGLTQVLPATGELLAASLGHDSFDADDLYKPLISIEFGAAFLMDQLDRFGNRIYPALAAYNAGPGASQRWLDLHGDDMDLWAERIPYPETSLYIDKVFTYYGRYRLVYRLAE